MNSVIISGNLTADPEMRYAPTGTAVASFNVAINRKWKDAQTGELKEEVSFIGCVSFGKTAETIGQYFKKGAKIFLQGRLKQEVWDDKQTQKQRSKTVVIVESFEFGQVRAPDGITPRNTPSARPPTADVPTPGSGPSSPLPDADDDSIPFAFPPRTFDFLKLI